MCKVLVAIKGSASTGTVLVAIKGSAPTGTVLVAIKGSASTGTVLVAIKGSASTSTSAVDFEILPLHYGRGTRQVACQSLASVSLSCLLVLVMSNTYSKTHVAVDR